MALSDGAADGGLKCWMCSRRACLIVGGGALVSSALYALYRYYRGRKDNELGQDEGFEDTTKVEEPQERKVLVLGLDGAGKSSILLGLTGAAGPYTTQPNEGFNVVCFTAAKVPMSFWEIGGSSAMRKYWSSFIQDTRILMYVVDSADVKRLPESFNELHRIIGDDRLSAVPIVIVANKQDVVGALSCEQVLRALAMDSVNRQRFHVDCVATQAPPSADVVGIKELRTVLERLSVSS